EAGVLAAAQERLGIELEGERRREGQAEPRRQADRRLVQLADDVVRLLAGSRLAHVLPGVVVPLDGRREGDADPARGAEDQAGRDREAPGPVPVLPSAGKAHVRDDRLPPIPVDPGAVLDPVIPSYGRPAAHRRGVQRREPAADPPPEVPEAVQLPLGPVADLRPAAFAARRPHRRGVEGDHEVPERTPCLELVVAQAPEDERLVGAVHEADVVQFEPGRAEVAADAAPDPAAADGADPYVRDGAAQRGPGRVVLQVLGIRALEVVARRELDPGDRGLAPADVARRDVPVRLPAAAGEAVPASDPDHVGRRTEEVELAPSAEPTVRRGPEEPDRAPAPAEVAGHAPDRVVRQRLDRLLADLAVGPGEPGALAGRDRV